jgi:hypothetical protein
MGSVDSRPLFVLATRQETNVFTSSWVLTLASGLYVSERALWTMSKTETSTPPATSAIPHLESVVPFGSTTTMSRRAPICRRFGST